MKTLGMLAVALLLLPSPVRAESLAEAAKREQARREKNKQEGVKPIVITQDDVKEHKDSSADTPSNAGGSSASSKAGSLSLGTETLSPSGASEEAWRSRAQAARDRVAAARKRLAETPEGIRKETDAYGLDNRTHGTMISIVPNPAYAAAQSELKNAEKALADLDDEARRAGALPGWIR
jgi:hypothetical protein